MDSRRSGSGERHPLLASVIVTFVTLKLHNSHVRAHAVRPSLCSVCRSARFFYFYVIFLPSWHTTPPWPSLAHLLLVFRTLQGLVTRLKHSAVGRTVHVCAAFFVPAGPPLSRRSIGRDATSQQHQQDVCFPGKGRSMVNNDRWQILGEGSFGEHSILLGRNEGLSLSCGMFFDRRQVFGSLANALVHGSAFLVDSLSKPSHKFDIY